MITVLYILNSYSKESPKSRDIEAKMAKSERKINPIIQAIQQKKEVFKVENKKIVINKELLNDKQKVLDFINKKGVYHIKINKKVLFKTLK